MLPKTSPFKATTSLPAAATTMDSLEKALVIALLLTLAIIIALTLIAAIPESHLQHILAERPKFKVSENGTALHPSICATTRSSIPQRTPRISRRSWHSQTVCVVWSDNSSNCSSDLIPRLRISIKTLSQHLHTTLPRTGKPDAPPTSPGFEKNGHLSSTTCTSASRQRTKCTMQARTQRLIGLRPSGVFRVAMSRSNRPDIIPQQGQEV